MDNETVRTDGATGSSYDVVGWFRNISIATALLILIQVILAGRGFFIDYDLIESHGVLGNVTLLGGIGLVILGYVGYRRNLLDRIDLAAAVLLALLLVAQIGLGYSGRDSSTAASLHWPNGVLISLLTATLVGRSLPRRA
jgi:hypothetical protein